MIAFFRGLNQRFRILFLILTLCTILASLLSGCQDVLPQSNLINSTEQPTSLPRTDALVTFRTRLPAPLPAGDSLYLTILDEITGLALNTQTFIMQAEDETHYVLMLPVPLSSLIKYRYTRQGISYAQEHLSDGRPVRYRLTNITGPAVVSDIISRWTDTSFSGQTGRLNGQVFDHITRQPLPNLMVAAGGFQTYTRSDGSFLIEGLPVGKHNLVVYSLDGSFQPFQQEAVINPGSTTLASVSVLPAKFVTITYNVSVPPDTPPNAPLRLAGNLYQLGNTFADLTGGVSTLASRMPIMTYLPDGGYTLTISLPVNADVRYKYTLGDGFWNAERTSDGGFQVHQLIVPDHDIQIQDQVASWGFGSFAPISFKVNVPGNTPPDETVFIQFNPSFGWTESIPMWTDQSGDNSKTWQYTLFGPLDMVETLKYRYCREGQCGVADDIQTQGSETNGYSIIPGESPQVRTDQVTEWVWLPRASLPAVIPNTEILPRERGFVAGIAFQPDYRPSWGSRMPAAISEADSLGINWLILSPTWSYTSNTIPDLDLSPDQDASWFEVSNWISQARQLSLNTGLFPTPHFPTDQAQWWQQAPRDFSWWVSWFSNYHDFMIHYANLAARNNAQSLILGGKWLEPALPNGILPDGSSSNVPQDAESRWRALIAEIKGHFSGKLVWSLSYPRDINNPPPFLDLFDEIDILWSAPLSHQGDTSDIFLLEEEALRILDQDILPFQQKVNKPVVLVISYPSVKGALSGCITSNDGSCLDSDLFSQTTPVYSQATTDLQVQEAGYNAVLMAVNQCPWVKGVISLGFYPPLPLEDQSISVHGKPASGVLWYWFPKFLGK